MQNGKLNYIIVCENAFLSDPSKNLSLINTFDTINANSFPILFPRFSVVVNATTTNIGNHEAVLDLTKDGTILNQIKMTFVGEKIQAIQNFIGFKFAEEGQYVFDVKLDGQSIGSTTLFLKKV